MELKQYIERIQRLTEEKKEVQTDIKEVYRQAKGEGYDTKVMKQVIKILNMPEPDRKEYEYLINEYLTQVN